MGILLLSLVVVGVIFITGYYVWFYTRKVEVPDHTIEERNKNRIVETVYKEAHKKKEDLIGTHIFKISILNRLNISPNALRDCIKQLIKEQLVIETDECVALTSFGVQYYEIFVRRIMSKKKAKK